MVNFRKTFLSCMCLPFLLPSIGNGQTQENEKSAIKVIDPDKQVPAASAAALDTENFELGIYTGMLSVEDFNSNPLIGVALRYYFNEKFLVEGNIGTSETDRANTEGNQDFNPERDFSYFGVAAGYQILKGRSFLGKKRKFNTGLYLLGGLEQVDFADETETGMMIGLSYKTVLTDWLTINLDFRNHIVNREFIDDEKMTQNTEISVGINTIF